MHPVQAGGNGVARVEVIAGAGAHVHGESIVLSLRVIDAERSFGVNDSQAGADIGVGHEAPVGVNKISTEAHVVGEIVGLGAPGNRGDGAGEGDIPVAAENPRTAYVVDMPAQRGEDGDERVSKRVEIVRIAFEDVEGKRDIDGEPSHIEGELQLVAVVNVAIEVGGLRAWRFFSRGLDLWILAGTQRGWWGVFSRVGGGCVEGFGGEVEWRTTEGSMSEVGARKRIAVVPRIERQTRGLVTALLGPGERGEDCESGNHQEHGQGSFAEFCGS